MGNFCSKCGNGLSNEDTFCPNCGSRAGEEGNATDINFEAPSHLKHASEIGQTANVNKMNYF